MSFCTKCGAELPEGAAFCTRCGAPVRAPQRRQRVSGREIWDAASAQVKARWRYKIGSKPALIAAAAALVVVVLVVIISVTLKDKNERGNDIAPPAQTELSGGTQTKGGADSAPGAAQTLPSPQPQTDGGSGGEAQPEAGLHRIRYAATATGGGAGDPVLRRSLPPGLRPGRAASYKGGRRSESSGGLSAYMGRKMGPFGEKEPAPRPV